MRKAQRVKAIAVAGIMAAMLGWGGKAHALLYCPSGTANIAITYDRAGSTLQDSFAAGELNKTVALTGNKSPSLPGGRPTCTYAASRGNVTVTAQALYAASASNLCRAARFSAVVTSGTFRGTVASFTVASGTKTSATGSYRCRYTLPIRVTTLVSSLRSYICTRGSTASFGMKPECDVVQGPIRFVR